MRAWWQLLRISLAPTILWDVVAGALLAGLAVDAALLAPLACLLLIYHGGMALNDFADRGLDARTRPRRPIPSGRVAPFAALVLGLVLVGSGVAIAWLRFPPVARQGVMLLAVVVLVYDLGGPLLRQGFGPPLLAVARGISLALPALAAGLNLFADKRTIFPYLAYALYFLFLSRLASREERGSPGMRALAFLIATALAPILILPEQNSALFLLGWAAFASWLIWPALRDRHQRWEPRRVQAAIRRGLAAAPLVPGLALIAEGIWWGLAAPLAGLAVAALARALPPE